MAKPNCLALAAEMIAMQQADLDLRNRLIESGELFGGYHKEMEALHLKNAEGLESIIDQIGYPTIEKVGSEASQAAWLIIQHAISRPDFMKKCWDLLEQAVTEKQADPKDLAYLSDRIAAFEGRPQLYGTQFDWDEDGHMSPKAYDDLITVNERRKAMGLNTLEEQTKIMRAQAEKDGEQVPEDMERRKRDYESWRKRVGWC
ncbi:MAG: DUF6624 domain-containing protein [Bacteroidota bacterium]